MMGESIDEASFTESDVRLTKNKPGGDHCIGIGEESLFLLVRRRDAQWQFKLEDLYKPPMLTTSWTTLKSAEKLHLSPKAQFIRKGMKKRLDEASKGILERAITLIQDNEALWEPEEEEENIPDPGVDVSGEVKIKARELLKDPAFFYKLGKVMEHGFIVPKLNKPRFVVGEERNKRLTPLLLGASTKLGLTSLIRLLGDIGTAKDTIIRLTLTLSSQGLRSVERGYMTGGAFRYSEEIKNAEVLYLPDSPEMQGESGRQMRLNRSDDGGLIWGIAVKDKETGEWTEQTRSLGVKNIITSSSAVQIDQALESGAFTLGTDDDPGLTRTVQEEKLKLRAGKRPLFPDEELEVWKAALQIALTEDLPEHIEIPFADDLIFLLSKDSTTQRRSPDKLCDLIESIAFWTRFRKEEEKETASFEDLYHAIQLGLNALLKTIAPLDADMRAIFKKVEDALADDVVTVRYVTQKTKQGYNTIYKKLEYLVAKGYLAKDKAGNRNVYSPILSSKNEDKANQLLSTLKVDNQAVFKLLSPLFTPNQNSSTLIAPEGHILIDPLTGQKVTLKVENGKLIHNSEPVDYPPVYVSKPQSEMKRSDPPEEIGPNDETGIKERFIRGNKTKKGLDKFSDEVGADSKPLDEELHDHPLCVDCGQPITDGSNILWKGKDRICARCASFRKKVRKGGA